MERHPCAPAGPEHRACWQGGVWSENAAAGMPPPKQAPPYPHHHPSVCWWQLPNQLPALEPLLEGLLLGEATQDMTLSDGHATELR